MSNVIYDLQLDFRQKYSTSHALIHLTNKIRGQLDSGNFVCRIFAYLQKAFDIVDHDILIQKLNHYVLEKWLTIGFSSYLQNRLQYVSINDFNSKLEHIHCSVLNILGRLLFLIQ